MQKTTTKTQCNEKAPYIIFGAIVLVSVFISLSIFPIMRSAASEIFRPHTYVTSRYSKFCYSRHNVNPTIKVRIYYKDLASCGKPLKK